MPARGERSEWGFPNQATPLGSPVYYALRFSPADRLERDARLLAWFALVRGIAAQPRDPGIARLKLDWWRSELERVAAGSPGHPLSRELVAHGLAESALAPMRGIIDGAERQLRAPLPDSPDDLVDRCRSAEGLLFVLLGDAAPAAQQTALNAGGFCGLVERLRQAPVETSNLPAALHPERLAGLDRDERVHRIDALLERACPAGDTAALAPAARRWLAMTRATRNKLRRRGYPCAGPVVDRPPIAHLWTAWRCR